MLNDLAVPQLIHVDVLNLEVHPGRLHAYEHSTTDRHPPDPTMRSAECAANDDPFPFNYGILNGQLDIREGALDIFQDRPHTGTPNLPTVVSGVFRKKFRSGIHIAAIEGVVLLLDQGQVGVGVHTVSSCRGLAGRRPHRGLLLSSRAKYCAGTEGDATPQKMDRERIVQLFFFGFLAVMAYELYELLLPFLTPLAWGILLAFMAHPALIEVEKYVKRRSLSTAIISVVVSLGVILPAVWASGRLVVEAQALYVQATDMVNTGGVTKLHDWAVNTQLGAWVAKRMGEHGYKLDEELPKLTLQAAQITSDYVAKNAASAAKNVFGFIVDFGIALLAFFYMLRDGYFYYHSLQDLTPLHED